MLVLCSSCSTSSKGYIGGDYGSENVATSLNQTVSDNRLMIYNASITFDTKHTDSIHSKVFDIVQEKNGYILNSGSNYTTIRIPSFLLYETLNEISKLGKVYNKQVQGVDVTDEFSNYQIRLENANKTRNRYLELLQMAKDVQETLLIEKELERLNNEIDLLEG